MTSNCAASQSFLGTSAVFAGVARGVEFLMPYYGVLDHAPKGRDEDHEDSQLWTRRHDEYR